MQKIIKGILITGGELVRKIRHNRTAKMHMKLCFFLP